MSLEEELGASVLLLTSCSLTAFPLFLHPLTSLISNCFTLLFGTQRRPRRPKPLSAKQERRWHRGAFAPGSPTRFCLFSVAFFSWHTSVAEYGSQGGSGLIYPKAVKTSKRCPCSTSLSFDRRGSDFLPKLRKRSRICHPPNMPFCNIDYFEL